MSHNHNMTPTDKATIETRVRHWARLGLSHRAIAGKLSQEGMSLSYRGVGRILEKPAEGAPEPSPRPKAALAEAVERTVQDAKEAIEESDAGDYRDASFLAKLRTRWREVGELVEEMAPLSREGGRNTATYCQLVRLEDDLGERLERRAPPPPPEPDKDPANLEARASVLNRVAKMIEKAEGKRA